MKKKEKVIDATTDQILHEGYKCDSCGIEPIVGTRWKCAECPEDLEVDLCEACKVAEFETETHRTSHSFITIIEPETIPYYLDYDYNSPSEVNYLDPSFMSS